MHYVVGHIRSVFNNKNYPEVFLEEYLHKLKIIFFFFFFLDISIIDNISTKNISIKYQIGKIIMKKKNEEKKEKTLMKKTTLRS